ncbi:MAG TPA: hypothetical protein VHM26_15740, partial [Chitinophagaceae bacterium]|nr:hypothetical protein [Chitinophagaceae bacterium]
MKKFFLLAFFSIALLNCFGQSEKFVKAMEAKVSGIDTIRTSEGWQELANSFERIADAEKTQ